MPCWRPPLPGSECAQQPQASVHSSSDGGQRPGVGQLAHPGLTSLLASCG